MALTNLLKPQVDQPVFEWMRFAPATTSAVSALASSDSKARYMYYVVGQALWRYDTYSDSWHECAAPNIAPSNMVALKYAQFSGHRGHVVSATSSTLTVPGFSKHAHLPDDLKVRIIAGTGAGQERTISSVSDSTIHDFGVVTTASAASIADSTKKWRVNQWDAYQCRLVYSTGATQVRRVLYNDATTLYFNDTNFQAIDSFNNTGFSAVSPYAVPVTTAGSQTHYVLESAVLTLDSSWTVTPDTSSIYQIMSGGLWLFSSAVSAPFTSMQFYDILTDTWQSKTPIGGHLTAAFSTECCIDRTGEAGGTFVTSQTATSGTSRTLVNSGASMEVDRYANHQLRITGGTGVGQKRRIVGHNGTTFWVDKKWDVNPNSSSVYSIYGETDRMWVSGNASSCIWGYSVEEDLWFNGHMSSAGIARNISATPASAAGYGPPHQGFGVSGIVYNANGITAVAVNAAGTNYVVGDLVTLSTTGTGATAWVTGVGASGAVTSLQLANSGINYTSVTSSATTGGSGSGLTITTTVGKSAVVTTATNHDFRFGDGVAIAGCATDTSFNATFTIIGVGSLTTFSIAAPSATASPTAASSQSTTLLVDAAANWDTNEHTGKIVHIQTAGISPTTQSRRITSNTATTLTIPSITAATNGTGRYVIQEVRGFGAMVTNKIPTKSGMGWATGGTGTTLVDSTKDWNNNQWINCKVRIVSGTGAGNESAVTANTATTLTVASWGVATPDTTSKYEILESFGVVTTAGSAVATITDANKNWTTNILAGKRMRVVAGTGIGTELAITSNTATVITCASTLTTDTTTVYEVFEIPARGVGSDLTWLFGLSDAAKKGRWLISPRGGASNAFDIYDIPSNTWDICPLVSPQSVTLTTGSMYVYDDDDTYFFNKESTGRLYALNLDTFKVDSAGTTPYAQGTSLIGQRMEIVKTDDGLVYLYIMRHSGVEMWRALKFW